MTRVALIIALLLASTLARSDGIFNPGSRGINLFEGPLNSGAPIVITCVPGAPTGQMDFSVCSNIAITAALP